MSTYPTTITAEKLAELAHISDAEVRRDIADTEREAAEQDARAASFETLARMGGHERRVHEFRATAARQLAGQMRGLVVFLNLLLAARAESRESVLATTEG